MDLTSLLLIAGAGLYAVGAALTLAALRRAPDGYEDDNGFHAEPHA
jgi:hypothetical protein